MKHTPMQSYPKDYNTLVTENDELRRKLGVAECAIAFHIRDADAQFRRAEALQLRIEELEGILVSVTK